MCACVCVLVLLYYLTKKNYISGGVVLPTEVGGGGGLLYSQQKWGRCTRYTKYSKTASKVITVLGGGGSRRISPFLALVQPLIFFFVLCF